MAFIDVVHVKIREGNVANRPIYAAPAVTCEGIRAKSEVQALVRSQPAFPMMSGLPEKRTHTTMCE